MGVGNQDDPKPRSWRGLLSRSRWMFFFLPIGIQGAVTLVTIPVVVHTGGLRAWTAIGIGQSVGAFGFAVQNLGWGITGPAQLGMLDREQRPHLMTVSVVTKALVFLPLALGMLIVVAVLRTGATELAFAGCLGVASTGFAGSWYFVGLNQPARLLLLEAFPRVGLMVLGLGALLLGAPVIFAPLAQLAGSMAAALVCWMAVERAVLWRSLQEVTRDEVTSTLRLQFKAVGIQATVAAFANAPLPVLASTAPAITTPFALYDKVQKQALAAATPLGTIVVAGMADRLGAQGPLRAARSSTIRLAGIASIALVGMSLATGFLVPLLSLGRLSPSPLESVLVGATVAFGLVVNTFAPAVLAPLSLVGRGLLPVLVGGCCSVVFAVTFAHIFGLVGALLGVVVGQVVTICMQAFVAWQHVRAGTRNGAR